MTELDIRDFKERGYELKIAIANAVQDTQRVIIRTLPDVIIMTKKQFKMLRNDEEMQHTTDYKEHLYLTPHNAMEVVVK